jgi:hypothetical protein
VQPAAPRSAVHRALTSGLARAEAAARQTGGEGVQPAPSTPGAATSGGSVGAHAALPAAVPAAAMYRLRAASPQRPPRQPIQPNSTTVEVPRMPHHLVSYCTGQATMIGFALSLLCSNLPCKPASSLALEFLSAGGGAMRHCAGVQLWARWQPCSLVT